MITFRGCSDPFFLKCLKPTLAMLILALGTAMAQAQEGSLVFGIRSTASAGGTEASVRGGFEEEFSLTARMRKGVLRISLGAAGSLSGWYASALRWASYSESQTLRWSLPCLLYTSPSPRD
ncbi:MAG: hypothetical protein N3A02_01890, partial [Rectinema sp.]|nr:hypothetical protein [Rectinema sp.]